MNIGLNFGLLENLYQEMVNVFPKIIGGIVYIIVSYFLLKLLLILTKYILKVSKIDNLKNALNNNDFLKNSSLEVDPQKIILQFVKVFILLLIIIIGSDIFGLTVVSRQIGRIIDYLPQFFSALIIFIGGFYLANYVKNLLKNLLNSLDLNGASVVGNILFYIILVFTILTSLNQAGINTDLITNNLSLIIGALLLTISIAFGLGSKDIVYRILLSFYANKNFEVGQKIIIDDEIQGTILSIDNISLILHTGEKQIVYPIKVISNKKIQIISSNQS